MAKNIRKKEEMRYPASRVAFDLPRNGQKSKKEAEMTRRKVLGVGSIKRKIGNSMMMMI